MLPKHGTVDPVAVHCMQYGWLITGLYARTVPASCSVIRLGRPSNGHEVLPLCQPGIIGYSGASSLPRAQTSETLREEKAVEERAYRAVVEELLADPSVIETQMMGMPP